MCIGKQIHQYLANPVRLDLDLAAGRGSISWLRVWPAASVWARIVRTASSTSGADLGRDAA